jgi:hypothetical protein
VENSVIEETVLGVLPEVRAALGRVVFEKFDDNVAMIRLDSDHYMSRSFEKSVTV